MEFVTFEIAKKLKEKGFDWETSNVYERNTLACRYEDYPKPTISQVLKWLREEKNLFIDISLCAEGYYGMIYSTIFPKDEDFSDGWLIDGKYQTYGKAALAGIEYVIDKLI